MTPALLTLSSVVVEYADGDQILRPLDRVSLELQSGEMVALVGPSGSGKTTLLNFTVGILQPAALVRSGTVMLLGESLTRSRDFEHARRNRISYVGQDDNLLEFLSVEENVRLPRLLKGRRRVDPEVAGVALEQVGLKGLDERKPGEISAGQRQRVAVARALAQESNLLVLDEPTAALDSSTADGLVELLLKLTANGTGVLLATHDLACASRSTRVLRLSEGALIE